MHYVYVIVLSYYWVSCCNDIEQSLQLLLQIPCTSYYYMYVTQLNCGNGLKHKIMLMKWVNGHI